MISICCIDQICLIQRMDGWGICVNLKKMVEFVKKVLYNEDELNEKYRNNNKKCLHRIHKNDIIVDVVK